MQTKLTTMYDMLAMVNQHFGYTLYTLRRTPTGNYALDVFDEDQTLLIIAERLGTLEEIYNFIAGMFRMTGNK